ncbi:MAG: helix-turn-helix transcriptional regulator [Chitinophagaceae bacterium]
MSNDLFLKEIGRKVKAARKANRLSLPKMSVATGIVVSNLWFLENGQRNMHILTLKSIADVLKMDVKEFL